MEEKDLLLQDLEYVRSSFWKNEEIGEKRFNFFITIVTASAGALVALAKVPGGSSAAVHSWVLAVLFMYGVLTYARMLHRNAVSDNYKALSDYIWGISWTFCKGLQDRSYALQWKPKAGLSRWMRAGYTDVIGAINGTICGLLVFNLGFGASIGIASGVLLAVASWIPSVLRK